jgi:hypothetical protein
MVHWPQSPSLMLCNMYAAFFAPHALACRRNLWRDLKILVRLRTAVLQQVKSSQVNTLPRAKSKTRSKQNKDMHKFRSVYSERGVHLPVLTSGSECVGVRACKNSTCVPPSLSVTSLKLLIQQVQPHVRVERDSGMCVARGHSSYVCLSRYYFTFTGKSTELRRFFKPRASFVSGVSWYATRVFFGFNLICIFSL